MGHFTDGITGTSQKCTGPLQPFIGDIAIKIAACGLFKQSAQVREGYIHFGSQMGDCKIRVCVMQVNGRNCITVQGIRIFIPLFDIRLSR